MRGADLPVRIHGRDAKAMRDLTRAYFGIRESGTRVSLSDPPTTLSNDVGFDAFVRPGPTRILSAMARKKNNIGSTVLTMSHSTVVQLLGSHAACERSQILLLQYRHFQAMANFGLR